MYHCRDTKNVILFTIKGTVYVSNDHGVEWKNIHPAMQNQLMDMNKGYKETRRTKYKFDGVLNIVQHPANKDKMVFIGNENVSFRTSNCGGIVTPFKHRKGISKLEFHPTDENKLLLLSVKKRKCLTPLCLPDRNLYLSIDFGKTVNKVEKNVLDFGWAYVEETARKGFPKYRVILLKQVEGESKSNSIANSRPIAFPTLLSRHKSIQKSQKMPKTQFSLKFKFSSIFRFFGSNST